MIYKWIEFYNIDWFTELLNELHIMPEQIISVIRTSTGAYVAILYISKNFEDKVHDQPYREDECNG
jgi:hypothetical protein